MLSRLKKFCQFYHEKEKRKRRERERERERKKKKKRERGVDKVLDDHHSVWKKRK